MIKRYITNLIAVVVFTAGVFAISMQSDDKYISEGIWKSIASTQINSALCFIFSAIALFIINISYRNTWIRFLCHTSIALTIIVAFLTLLEYFTDLDFNIAQFFITEVEARKSHANIELIAALEFFGVGLILTELKRGKTTLISQILLPAIFLVAVFITFNYVSGLNYLSNLPFAVNTAVFTSLSVMVLCFGIFYSAPLRKLNYSYQEKIAGYFGITILLLGIIFFTISVNNADLTRNVERVDHTKNVLSATSSIMLDLHEIESFMRDFTLKPEQTYLDGIDRLSDSVDSNMKELFRLTEDNKIQKGRLDSLTYLLAYDAGNRNTSIARKRDTSNSHIVTAEMLFAEQITKTRIREVIYKIQEEETRLLSGRSLQTMKTVNGSQRIIKVIGVLVFGMLLVMFLVIYRNTVSRNAAEAALRKNEKFIRSIIDNTSSTISIKDTEGRFMLVNKQGENFIGKKESELIGKTMFDLVPFENAVEGEAYDKAAMEAGKLVEFEVQTPDSLGGKYYLSSRFPLFDENNKVYAVCSMSTDISWVKAAQAEVEKASRLQQHMLNNLQYLTEASADVICIADEDGIYRQISANCKHLFGYEADEMIGHHFADFILEEDKQPSIDHRTVLFSEMLTTGYENRIVRKDGVVVPLMWTNVWSEETRLVYSIIKDATEKKMTARQLADLNESLKKRASELQASNTELERFAYVASHDLQEPLRMVSSFLQLLEKKLEGTLDETGRKYIAFAVDGAERMKTLIQDLLQYSRIGTSKELVVNVDLNDVLKTVASFYSLAISETDAELHISQMPVIKAEKAQMQQLFQNLVGNAIKYSKPKKPIVTVGYEEEPEHWLFFVKDQGIGISPKFYEKIFIIFQRLHTKTEYSGTGIGLAICKKIVERHGGTIWVESELELGTTFFVRLPKY